MDEKTSEETEAAKDLEKLAKEYVDLWEAQIKALAGDEALAQTMAQTVGLMNASAANVAAAMQAMTAQGQTWNGRDGATDVDSTSSDRVASGDPELDVHELHRRIADLEERIAALEGRLKDNG